MKHLNYADWICTSQVKSSNWYKGLHQHSPTFLAWWHNIGGGDGSVWVVGVHVQACTAPFVWVAGACPHCFCEWGFMCEPKHLPLMWVELCVQVLVPTAYASGASCAHPPLMWSISKQDAARYWATASWLGTPCQHHLCVLPIFHCCILRWVFLWDRSKWDIIQSTPFIQTLACLKIIFTGPLGMLIKDNHFLSVIRLFILLSLLYIVFFLFYPIYFKIIIRLL